MAAHCGGRRRGAAGFGVRFRRADDVPGSLRANRSRATRAGDCGFRFARYSQRTGRKQLAAPRFAGRFALSARFCAFYHLHRRRRRQYAFGSAKCRALDTKSRCSRRSHFAGRAIAFDMGKYRQHDSDLSRTRLESGCCRQRAVSFVARAAQLRRFRDKGVSVTGEKPAATLAPFNGSARMLVRHARFSEWPLKVPRPSRSLLLYDCSSHRSKKALLVFSRSAF